MAMKYLAAHLMAVVAGDSHPSKAKIEAILQSIGAEIDEEVLAAFLHKVEGKNAHELIAAGLGKLSSFAAAGPAASSAGAASPSKKAAASPKAAAKKEEVCKLKSFLCNMFCRMRMPETWVSAFSIRGLVPLRRRLVKLKNENRHHRVSL
jgi:large subunit ribosomal protein LP2